MNNVIEALIAIGYPGVDESYLKKILEDGPKSVKYTQLVEWLSKELKFLCSLDDHVNAISSSDDSSSFLLEVSGFLKEIGCSYKSLTEGHINDRLNTPPSRLLLLDYLVSEVQAARMIKANHGEEPKTMSIQLQESPTAADLKNLLITLKFAKPPENITPEQLFGKVQAKIKEVLGKVPADLLGKPLFTGVLTDKQWHRLTQLQTDLNAEYTIRREMLLKRLDVTILSFEWSDKMRNKGQEISGAFSSKRQLLKIEPSVDLADVLAARDDLAIIEKTSCANVRRNTQSKINKVVIGSVPDRGGRPNEQQPPPPEMPSWQQRSSAPSSGGFSGGSGGGNRGGTASNLDVSNSRVQAGWNAGGGPKHGDNYQGNRNAGNQNYKDANKDSRGGYQNNKAGYQDNRGGYQDRGSFQDNRIGYQDNKGGYQDNSSRGGYQDTRGGYHENRGSYQDSRSGYQDNRGGYHQDNRGAYQDNRGGYQDNRGGYHQNNRGGYQDNRGSYQDYQNSRGGSQSNRGAPKDVHPTYHNSSNSRGSYQNVRGGYQDNRGGYQDVRNNYQNCPPNYQDSRGGYQNFGSNFADSGAYQDSRNSFQDPRMYQQENKSGYLENRDHFDGGRGGYNARGGNQNRGRGRGRGRGY